jgi:hypothetical protein
MDFFNEAINVVQTVVLVLGFAWAAWGGLTIFRSFDEESGAQRNKGIGQLVAGGGIVAVALLLIPMIGEQFDDLVDEANDVYHFVCYWLNL